mmetsp:Transcript_34914/g.78689  ORF Transcript_34914/g.78689 Transcript_34914/m.78689 type:complete len:216 (-) Transcript_34914:121-768(-)
MIEAFSNKAAAATACLRVVEDAITRIASEGAIVLTWIVARGHICACACVVRAVSCNCAHISLLAIAISFIYSCFQLARIAGKDCRVGLLQPMVDAMVKLLNHLCLKSGILRKAFLALCPRNAKPRIFQFVPADAPSALQDSKAQPVARCQCLYKIAIIGMSILVAVKVARQDVRSIRPCPIRNIWCPTDDNAKDGQFLRKANIQVGLCRGRWVTA